MQIEKQNLISLIRHIFWRILGVDYRHILRVIDFVYLKECKPAKIGTGTYDNNALVYRWTDASLDIGKYCSISYNVRFILDNGSHFTNQVTSYPFNKGIKTEKVGIKVGNDVWIGMDSIIMCGVTIGNGATIAAGAIVTKDVPSYCIVGGVPARIIKHKCTDDEKKEMESIAWWNWDKDVIEERKKDFLLSIPNFIEKYGQK